MYKGDHSHQSASQYPKVLLKMITNTNTFLDIHNYVQKENEEKKRDTTTTPPSMIPLTQSLGRSECRQPYPCKYHYSQRGRFQKTEEKKRERERKMKRSYQVRCCVHLSYYLLRTMLREVEEASAAPSNLKIQAYSSDAVKALRSLSYTPACILE